MAEALEAQPGLRLVQDVTGAVQIQLRGFGTDHVLVLVDGRRLPGRKNGAIDPPLYATRTRSSFQTEADSRLESPMRCSLQIDSRTSSKSQFGVMWRSTMARSLSPGLATAAADQV